MSERLTLVVFKDHLSSRTLTVRLAWLRAFGLALLSVIGLAVVAAALFLNAYRKTIATGSVATTLRVEELEKELAESKSSYEAIKNQALNSATTGGAVLAGANASFSLLPAESVLEKLPAPETLPFRLEAIKAQWKGSTLQIRSAIEYTREDGGNQQGHFVILVRGPQSVAAYPDGAFDAAGAPTLIKPETGEFFSVSRYREIKADFGPYSKRDDVRSIELFIFDPKNRLIFLSRSGLESAKAAPAPAKKTESSANDDGDSASNAAPAPAPKAKRPAPPKAAAPTTETPPAEAPPAESPGNPPGSAPEAAPAAEGGT
ncbi:MAG: hypothetical protein JST04_17335 [Bdellovibrionales bacterium]|nr:hypothetical protein [Bdellovibrionales bacterium]